MVRRLCRRRCARTDEAVSLVSAEVDEDKLLFGVSESSGPTTPPRAIENWRRLVHKQIKIRHIKGLWAYMGHFLQRTKIPR